MPQTLKEAIYGSTEKGQMILRKKKKKLIALYVTLRSGSQKKDDKIVPTVFFTEVNTIILMCDPNGVTS